MSTTIINSDEYIAAKIKDLDAQELINDQMPRLVNSMRVGFKTLFNGRKWLLYLAINALLLFIPMLAYDNSFDNFRQDYIFFIFENIFPFIFVFGCLILSLPLSADEISDNVVDFYLVRPLKRETYWLSRWIVVNIAVYVVNAFLFFVYYVYYSLFATEGFGQVFFQHIDLYGKMLVLLLSGTLVYSGFFLLIGMIGNRGFTLGIFMAIFEPFFISLLFLQNSPYIPQTNVMRIASVLFENEMAAYLSTDAVSHLAAWIYTFAFSIVILFIGALYLRKREFNG